MLPGLHVAVFFFSALLTVGSGDEVSVDLCKLPDGVFPDPDNCGVFIRCQSRVPDVEPCPDSLLFNPFKLTCDFSKTGNCSDLKDFDETSAVQTNDVVCSEDGPNVYPIQSSCTEYYMCDNNSAFKVKCPKGLLMNADKMTCDYPENVDCDSFSSPEESTVGMKAVYEDDEDLESETKSSYSSIETSLPSAKTTSVEVKSETDFDSKEMTGYTSNNPEETTSTTLNSTRSSIADKTVSANPEITSTLGSLDQNITNNNTTLKEPGQPKEKVTFSEVKPTRTDSDQDITGTTSVFTSTKNVKDVHGESISSISDAHRERSNLEDPTEESNDRDTLTSDKTVTDLSSNKFRDFQSSESSQQSTTENSATSIQASDKNINNEGSGSDMDIIDIFTTDSNNGSQQLDVSTNDISTSNNLIHTVTNEPNLNTKTSSSDKTMTSESLSESLENVSTLDSEVEVEFTKEVTDLSSEGIGTETTKSEVSLSSSNDLINQTDVTNNKARGDNITSDVESTEMLVTDFNLNESTTLSSVLTTLGTLEPIKNESHFKVTTKTQTVVETDNKIAPEKTLTTTQALMSSDPLTDNETTRVTTSTFFETVKVTPKYIINTTTATTEEHQSFDSEASESASLSDDQNEGYEDFTESVGESKYTFTPESNIFTEKQTERIEYIVSSHPTETSISEVNTEISEINDISSEDIAYNNQNSLSNEFSTSSKLHQNSESTSNSDFVNEVISTEVITSSEKISSEHISENVETKDASETKFPVTTKIENSTESAINEETAISNSIDLSKAPDSDLSVSAATNAIFDKSESPMKNSQERYSTMPLSTSVPLNNEKSTVSETQMNNSSRIFNEFSSENQYPTLTSTNLKLTDGDVIAETHLTTRQNTKVTEITSVEISDMFNSTSNSTKHTTTANAFSGFTESIGNDVDLTPSSLETQLPDDTTETIDLSSESDVTKVDQTYIDMYTNKSASNLESSSAESFTAFTDDLESLTYKSTLANKNENLTLGSSEVSISSVTERSQSTVMESSSDLTSILLHTKTKDADVSVKNEQLPTSEDDFDSSKSTSKYTRINSSETELPYEIHTSTLSEISTNVSDSNVDTHTKESLSSVLMSSLHPPKEPSIQISETNMDFDVIVTTPGVTYPEYILSSENEDTSTDVSRDNLNNKTTTDFIHTASNKIDNESETIFPSKVSTGQIDDSSQTPLSKNTDSFEITSNSIGPGTVREPGATLESSEISKNLKGVSTDNYTLQIKSTESTPKINETPKVSKETSKTFDGISTVNDTVVDNGTNSTTENNLTNMYEGSSTSDAMDAFKNTSVVTVSSVIDNTNETSESFWPETKEITNENNRTSIIDESTTILDSVSDTVVQGTISEVTSIVNTTDMDGEISSFDISSPAVSYSKDSVSSTSAIATKQNYLSTSSSLQITNSLGSTPDSSDSTDLTLPITYFNDSDNSIQTVNETSESPKYTLNVTGTSITSTKDSYSSDININPENTKSTKETSDITITEFISTKLNSETPDTYETSQFTDRRFEETSSNPQTTFDIESRNTNTEWFSKSNIDRQTTPSDSISFDKSTSDISISDVKTKNIFKTTDTPSTKTATYNETPELDTVSKNKFSSPANLVSSTETLYESTSLSSPRITSKIPSKATTETSRSITDILPTSPNVFINSSEIDSSSSNPTEISESSEFFTDYKRVTIPRTDETKGSLSTNEETDLTDSVTKILSISSSASKFATEISGESSVHTTSFTRIITSETENPFSITATTRDTTKENNTRINDETTLNTNTDSISITSKILPEDRKTDDIFSTTDSSVVKTTQKKTTFSKDISEISGESSVLTTSFTRIIDTETENHFPVTETTRDTTKENNTIINDETTLNTNTDSVSITSKTLPKDRETDDILSTTDSSVVKTKEKKTTFSKDISESEHTISTTEITVLKTDTAEIITQSKADFTSVSMTSRDIEEEVNSTEYSSTTYFPSNVRTETSHSSSNTDIENENKDASSSDNSFSQSTITESHSKSISESDLPLEPTVETTVLIFNDTNKSTTESITDVLSVSTTNRNIDRKTESIEDQSTTQIPPALRTETSHSSVNTDTENENKELSSSDIPFSQSTVTESHSKGISESDLPLEPTVETTVLIVNDTNKTTTESITDVSNASITSRNIDRKTESIEDPSTTYIPTALRTETSHSFVNTETESELQRISSTDIPSESKTTMNPICVTSEGNFPHPDDCNKFYRCTKGVPVQSSCVGNEHFDPIKRICTSPCLAKCDPNADCGTTESKTNEVESTPSQTASLKDISSTSESYNTGTEETSFSSAHNYLTEDTTLDKINKSTFEETSTATNIASRSSAQASTTEKFLTDSSLYDELSSTIVDINATNDLTEVSSDYMSSSFRNITSDASSLISSDVPVTSTTMTYEISPETQTELTGVISSTVKSSTETLSSKSLEFTASTDITAESSGDGEDSSSTGTLIISTNCENEDCLSSKLQTSATLVPFRLCPRNDFLSEPNCSEYLDCTGKVPKKLECPNGLHFNPSTRVCDWQYNAECGTHPKPLYEPTDLLKCPCKSCLIPSTKSCSHYYLCIGFTAYEMKCSNSLYFDKSKNTCNYAPLVDCSHLTSTSTTTEVEPTESSTKTSTIEISTSTKTTTPASFVCPSEEGLFRYPDNCGMFYQCANWYPHPFNCPGGTHFSETTKRCEYPCDAKCDLTLNCGISSTAPPSDQRCSCYNCRLPSSESCTKYIICLNGKARIEYCPWGKTFDARRSTCDWAHKVTCQPSVMCPERNGLFSHKDDCHKFVHCSNGIPYVKKCPSILEFDPIKQRCEWPNGRCNYIPVITRDVDYKNVEHRKGWKCPKTFGYYAVDQHCNKFYHCSFGTPTLKECSSGLLYNPRYQTCDWKKQVRCNSNRHLKPRKCRAYDHHVVCSDDRRPKPHVLCNMYYDCTAGRACAKQCPVGLYFNNVTGVCDLPENVKCLNPSEGDYSLKELSLKCASGEHARQVNPTNDSCFYHCRQGKVVSGCCSKGQVYNMHKDKCERRTKSLRI